MLVGAKMHFSCKSLWCDGHFLVRSGQMSSKRRRTVKSELGVKKKVGGEDFGEEARRNGNDKRPKGTSCNEAVSESQERKGTQIFLPPTLPWVIMAGGGGLGRRMKRCGDAPMAKVPRYDGVPGRSAETGGHGPRPEAGASPPEEINRKSTRLNSSHSSVSRMPSSA